MAESQGGLSHKLTLDERKKLALTGAKEVIHFDEERVELDTCRGIVTVHGSEMRLKCLSLDDGSVVIQGTIAAIIYDEPRQKRGLFR